MISLEAHDTSMEKKKKKSLFHKRGNSPVNRTVRVSRPQIWLKLEINHNP